MLPTFFEIYRDSRNRKTDVRLFNSLSNFSHSVRNNWKTKDYSRLRLIFMNANAGTDRMQC